MKSKDGRPSPQLIRSLLERHLNASYGANLGVEIDPHCRVFNRQWSSIHIFTVRRRDETRDYIVKVPRLPDQTVPELSWQSDELLRRGWREYSSIARLYNHFAAQDDPALQALHPEAYLQELNAVVMNFVPSTTVYENTVMIRHLLTAQGRERALKRLWRVGQWLGWLHNLPADNVPSEQVSSPGSALETLLVHAEALSTCPHGPQMIAGWESAIDRLRRTRCDRQVWIHGDFHMGNILILPGDGVLSLDAVLDGVDDPCADIGKLVVDLRTRRERLLSQGLVPSSAFVDQLINAFLEGYQTQAPVVDPLALALYEGLYLLEKWLQCHTTTAAQLPQPFGKLAVPLIHQNINYVLARMVKNWVARVHQLPI